MARGALVQHPCVGLAPMVRCACGWFGSVRPRCEITHGLMTLHGPQVVHMTSSFASSRVQERPSHSVGLLGIQVAKP